MLVLKEPGKFLVYLLPWTCHIVHLSNYWSIFHHHLSCSDLVNDVKNSLDRVMDEERFYGEDRVSA